MSITPIFTVTTTWISFSSTWRVLLWQAYTNHLVSLLHIKDLPCHQSTEIIMGDFNNHNTIWGYDETNKDGKAVESWMDVENLELIHDPKQPYSLISRRDKRGYNPDLLLASQEIAPNCNKITLDTLLTHNIAPLQSKSHL